MKKLIQNKSLLKSIQVFLVCLVVLGGLEWNNNIEAAWYHINPSQCEPNSEDVIECCDNRTAGKPAGAVFDWAYWAGGNCHGGGCSGLFIPWGKASAWCLYKNPPPTCTLAADTPINLGGSSNLTWTTSNGASASVSSVPADVSITPIDAGTDLPIGSMNVSPASDTTYTLTVDNGDGVTDTCTVDVEVNAPICFFTADFYSIDLNASSTLDWTVQNADAAEISDGVNPPIDITADIPSGFMAVSPTSATTYTLTATNTASGETTACEVTITIKPPTCDSFTATPSSIDSGDSSALTWETTNATSVSIDKGVGAVASDNAVGKNVFPASTTTYTLTVTNNDGGTAICQTTVTIFTPMSPWEGTDHGHYFKYDKDIKLVFIEGSEFLLRIAGGLALLMIIFGGVYYMVCGSNPDGQTKAKKVVTYAVIGLAIVLISYVIIAAIESFTV